MHKKNTQIYIGRFAPSPTGPAHFGTLLAAVASYLQAKKNNGKWLLRMEDVDTTRSVKDADTAILKTLQAHGFKWDGHIIYQSARTAFYNHALQQLTRQSDLFPCICSRKQLAESMQNIYPGNCRQRQLPEPQEHALRLSSDNRVIQFKDKVMGQQHSNLLTDCGDFIIKRRDGLFAYQLAVVVDDARQGVTEVVRGADLLDSTPRQIYLQQLLAYPQPDYLHIPLAVDRNGQKLSKSAGAASVDNSQPQLQLFRALDFLGQEPPSALKQTAVPNLWQWAIRHWDIGAIPKKKTIIVQ